MVARGRSWSLVCLSLYAPTGDNGRHTGDTRETDGRRTGDDPLNRSSSDLKTWENASQTKRTMSFFEKKVERKKLKYTFFWKFLSPVVSRSFFLVSRCCLPLRLPLSPVSPVVDERARVSGPRRTPAQNLHSTQETALKKVSKLVREGAQKSRGSPHQSYARTGPSILSLN